MEKLLFAIIFLLFGYSVLLTYALVEEKSPIPANYRPVDPRDYQLEIVEDTIIVFDSNRCVGKIQFINDKIGQLIYEDNH